MTHYSSGKTGGSAEVDGVALDEHEANRHL